VRVSSFDKAIVTLKANTEATKKTLAVTQMGQLHCLHIAFSLRRAMRGEHLPCEQLQRLDHYPLLSLTIYRGTDRCPAIAGATDRGACVVCATCVVQ
jgi:hypothetical protein